MQGAAAVVLCGLLGQMQVTTFEAPDRAVFSSRGNTPCIGALLKFNQGYLFPLKDVLLFIGAHAIHALHAHFTGYIPGKYIHAATTSIQHQKELLKKHIKQNFLERCKLNGDVNCMLHVSVSCRESLFCVATLISTGRGHAWGRIREKSV
jgi:hypothetical protein